MTSKLLFVIFLMLFILLIFLSLLASFCKVLAHFSAKQSNETKKLKGARMKCTCADCDNVWYYGEHELELGKDYKYFYMCPKCGSYNIYKKKMI